MASEVKPPFEILCDEKTGQVASVRLYGQDLLDPGRPCESELWVNGHPLPLRPHVDPNQPAQTNLKGERFVDQFSGWGLVLARTMGLRFGLKHPCYGIQTHVRRELCDQTYPSPGPGGPGVEAPLWVDTFSILNWNWKFWGDDTRMIFASSHSNGPTGEWGHCGYENDTPETCKRFLKNIWRRIYPGCLVIHGGLFYNIRTGHWLAITCRQPHVGYILNIEKAGRGVSYDFTLHAPFHPGDALQLPEVKFYLGPDRPSMMSWLGDYVTHYYEEPPEWVHKTTWGPGLGWNNQPTWTDQADFWEKQLDRGAFSGISYCLVTNRPIKSGTTPDRRPRRADPHLDVPQRPALPGRQGDRRRLVHPRRGWPRLRLLGQRGRRRHDAHQSRPPRLHRVHQEMDPILHQGMRVQGHFLRLPQLGLPARL